jgi:hypothetical protein
LYSGQPIICAAKISNPSTTPAVAPKYSVTVSIPDNRLGDIGESQLFDKLKSVATSYISNQNFEIRPGMAAHFRLGNTLDQPIVPNQTPILSQKDYRGIKYGTKYVYLMIMIQHGPIMEHPFDDGIKRPHTMFCVFFTKGLSNGPPRDGPYYCNGFNYERP